LCKTGACTRGCAVVAVHDTTVTSEVHMDAVASERESAQLIQRGDKSDSNGASKQRAVRWSRSRRATGQPGAQQSQQACNECSRLTRTRGCREVQRVRGCRGCQHGQLEQASACFFLFLDVGVWHTVSLEAVESGVQASSAQRQQTETERAQRVFAPMGHPWSFFLSLPG